jgi:hypothetical protein
VATSATASAARSPPRLATDPSTGLRHASPCTGGRTAAWLAEAGSSLPAAMTQRQDTTANGVPEASANAVGRSNHVVMMLPTATYCSPDGELTVGVTTASRNLAHRSVEVPLTTSHPTQGGHGWPAFRARDAYSAPISTEKQSPADTSPAALVQAIRSPRGWMPTHRPCKVDAMMPMPQRHVAFPCGTAHPPPMEASSGEAASHSEGIQNLPLITPSRRLASSNGQGEKLPKAHGAAPRHCSMLATQHGTETARGGCLRASGQASAGLHVLDSALSASTPPLPLSLLRPATSRSSAIPRSPQPFGSASACPMAAYNTLTAREATAAAASTRPPSAVAAASIAPPTAALTRVSRSIAGDSPPQQKFGAAQAKEG